MAIVLKCLRCGGPLDREPARVLCAKCGAVWPVIDGIPRFFQVESHYWGEVGRAEAVEFLDEARRGKWSDVVRARFTDPNMLNGVLNLQRAAWLPMLGLGEGAVALDVGSGYGVITHALALAVGEVASVEAVPERIGFTQERLRQEGLRNVTLVQASAISLPFPENSFDLIVVNGVLEWVGEWSLEADPRTVQLRFLRSLCGMLKSDGVLVLGIENRMGYNYFLGAIDHSGLPYTNLMPRRIATLALRRRNREYRTELNTRREYRTYTYTKGGYRKLLGEAGFNWVSGYWADPGYNEPNYLVPLSAPGLLRERLAEILDHFAPANGSSWKRALKRAFIRSPWASWLLPDFLFFAAKKLPPSNAFHRWVESCAPAAESHAASPPADGFEFSSFAHPFSDKSVLKVWKPAEMRNSIIIKANARAPESVPSEVERDFEKLEMIAKSLPANSRLRLPRPIGCAKIGKTTYCIESLAVGTPLSAFTWRKDYFRDEARAAKELGIALKAAAEVGRALSGLPGIESIDDAWYAAPPEVEADSKLRAKLERLRYFSAERADLAQRLGQHGDFTVENVILNRRTGGVEVIDWGALATGLPPLYDHLTLLFSASDVWRRGGATKQFAPPGGAPRSFLAMLIPGGHVRSIIAEQLSEVRESLSEPLTAIPGLIVEFLVIRHHYYVAQRVDHLAQLHSDLLRYCLEHEESLSLG